VTLQLKGLLLEEARTNNILYSQQVGNNSVGWVVNGASQVQASGIAPDNTNAAALITGDGTSTGHYVNQNGATNATGITSSVYLKAASNRWVQIFVNSDVAPYANFDVINGVVGSVGATSTASIQNVGNGWFRCTLVTTSATATGIGIALVTGSASTRVETNTLTTSFYAWGAQQEAGAFATSYIPTTSATVARSADNVAITSIPWFSGSTGTFVAQFDTVAISSNTVNRDVLSIAGVANTPRLYVNLTSFLSGFDGTNYVPSNNVASGGPFKTAWAYGGTTMSISTSGSTVATNTFVGSFSAATSINIGNFNLASEYLNGHIKSIQFYNGALTNAQLQTLTT
jgi:hypothetical protein